MSKKKRTPARARSAEDNLLDMLKVKSGSRRRALNEEERRLLVSMLTMQRNPLALDIERLVPKGSFMARILRHFEDTDISYALPLFGTIMTAASWLTQNGAVLEIAGVGKIRPTLWTIALAESGNAKTLAADRLRTILGDGCGEPPVRMLPAPGSDAQWIMDLAENNGSYWFQDEVGKFFSSVLREKLLARIKPWMLSAYSHEPISNRLRTSSVEIEDPAFTFFGLSVFSTWHEDIDAVSMLDGFCQRPNYVLAAERPDTSMFDHFLYFEGRHVAAAEADLRELWHALCAQPGAAGPYHLDPQVLPYLRSWWSGLRHQWGDAGVPASFIRRIGFSVLRYLVVLHFLFGKSRNLIDVETAHLATHFAEFHLESTREMLQTYDNRSAQRMQRVMEIRSTLQADGQRVNARNIQRRLGKAMREGLTADVLKAILETLDRVDLGEPFPEDIAGQKARAEAMAGRVEEIELRLKHNEQKRNERRLRNLRDAYRAGQRKAAPGPADASSPVASHNAPGTAADLASTPGHENHEELLEGRFSFKDTPGEAATVIPLRR